MAEAVQGLPPAVADGAQSSIAFTQSDRIGELGSAGEQLVAAAQQAFVDGISGALLLAAGIVAVTAVLVAVLAPSPSRGRAATAVPAEVPAEVPVCRRAARGGEGAGPGPLSRGPGEVPGIGLSGAGHRRAPAA